MVKRRQNRQDRIAALRESLRSEDATWGATPRSVEEVVGAGVRVDRLESGQVMVGGVSTTILSEEDAAKGDILVCMPWEGLHFFPDDVRGTCAMCERAIRFRPDAPKKPARACLQCVQDAQGFAFRSRSIFG